MTKKEQTIDEKSAKENRFVMSTSDGITFDDDNDDDNKLDEI